jgi:peptide deformylase
MALLDIHTYPDDILRRGAAPVEKVTRECRKLITDMIETMYEAPGIGLAANQIGQAIQVVTIDLQRPDDENGLIVLVNPEIISRGGEIVWEEGCLSIPEYFAKVKRCAQVTVRALDPDGAHFEIEAEGLLAVALQHELDHLQGRLFVDRLGPITRDIFRRKWKKKLKEAEEEAR